MHRSPCDDARPMAEREPLWIVHVADPLEGAVLPPEDYYAGRH
jgi:hypothetical protein